MSRMTVPILVAILFVLAGVERLEGQSGAAAGPSVVTADIAAGIEKHIAEQVLQGKGYFNLRFGDRHLELKLVRVHLEYLANLGPRENFACVDLVDVGGDMFDVDFFLEGDPGNMTVTETTVHKINGEHYYYWDQGEDGTWKRIPVTEAKEVHFGILRGTDEFEFLYRATLPEIPDAGRMWVPIAATNAFQTVEVQSIQAPGKQQTLTDREHGNQVLYLELAPQDGGKTLEIRYKVRRLEKAAYASEADEPKKHLGPERLVPAREDFRKIAEQVLAGKTEDLVRARALYDHVIDQMKYIKVGEGWGKGDAVYACDARTGNCTDYHAYFIALARSVGIPARFAIGAAIPADRNDGGTDGYHCWAEFHAEGKWWPIDISEADKYSALATYYFGHHPANRFEFSRGRDLVVEPGPTSGPLNFLAYPVLEIGGKAVKAKTQFLFKRTSGKK